jgi:hypothetical protein
MELTMPELPVRKFLDCSLYHLPKAIRDQVLDSGSDGFPIPLANWASDYGAFVYINDHDIIANPDYGVPQSVIQLFDLAREHGCDYILFDWDGPEIEGFELFYDNYEDDGDTAPVVA